MNIRKKWRSLDSGSQIAVYFRVSLQLIAVCFLLLLVVLSVMPSDTVSIPGWVAIASALVASVLTVVSWIAMGVQPELNFHTTDTADGRPHWSFGWGLYASFVVYAVVVVALALIDKDPAGQRGLWWFLAMWVFAFSAAATMVFWVRLKYRWLVIVGLSLVGTVAGWDAFYFQILLFNPALAATVISSDWVVRIARQMARARDTEAALQVSEERLRFAQELHDTLGQHLAAISLKAEVARALAQRNDDRLDSELAELQALARSSMSDMRAVAAGYRTAHLSTELTGATSLFASAGIQCTVNGSQDDIPGHLRELAAWFIREASTNVLKHSDARHVTLTLDTDSIEMRNDGSPNTISPLAGMRALQRRAVDAHATVELTARHGEFVAKLKLPSKSVGEI
ncbi:sensor histidine kinase [Corynebacterium sp. H113]|uniref:sensor histidine kinase n=1 Tax=Corynebacterium sp. H113 TaxID=3133419 RepID=UPI0030AC0BC1